jgi:purine-cytosine permease-like protein
LGGFPPFKANSDFFAFHLFFISTVLTQPSLPCCRRYLVIVPLILNAATVTGFCLLSAVVGGQTIASLNPDRVSSSVGIVITCLVALAVSLLGFKAVHFWERWTWIPSLISLVIAVGCGGHNLRHQVDAPPATASRVISYGCLIAGYFITFGGTSSDYTIYHKPVGVSKYVLKFTGATLAGSC